MAYHGVGAYRASEWIEYGGQRYDLKELSVLPDRFEKHLAYLKEKGYRPVSLKDFWLYRCGKTELPKKCAAITFDDGFKNFFDFARPLLKKYGYSATVFLVTDKMDSEDRSFLSWAQARRLTEEGFSLGAHTLSHPLLTALSFEAAERQIKESKKVIEEKTAKPVEFFCYPFGKFNSKIEGLVREAGFLGAVVTPCGPGIEEGPYAMKRVGINKNNSKLVFRFKTSGAFSWLREQRLLWRIVDAGKALLAFSPAGRSIN